MSDTPKVLYIVGWGRSGSTLLDTLLGELPGFFSTGELRSIWERGLVERRWCGCGLPVPDCPVWSEVLERMRPDADAELDPRVVMRWQKEAFRVRHTRKLLRARTADELGPPGPQYGRVVAALYRAIAETTQAQVIVDSSKVPSDSALLRLLPDVQSFFVQLVRDPRAVAVSWKRANQLKDQDPPKAMETHGPVFSTVTWLGWNLLAEAIRRRSPAPSLLLRYEDLVADPRGALKRISELVDGPPVPSDFLEERTATLGANHTVSGNPVRFSTGRISLTEDRQWVTTLPRGEGLLISGLASPLLRRYGYPLVPPSR